MDIEIEKARDEFLLYTEKYNLNDKNIKRKQLHSLRVMKISEEISKRLKLSEEEIKLAMLIGLLHDIGRFKQYQTIGLGDVIDGFDHGDYGVEILKKDIRKYIQTDKYDEIIKKAIKNHNKYKIEEGLSEKELLFAKIIRDADKVDILYESIDIYFKGQEQNVNKSILSDNIYNEFKSENVIKRERGVNLEYINNIVSVIAFIYDIYFKTTFNILKEKNYINKIIDRYQFEDRKTREEVKNIRNIANNYIDMKINEKKDDQCK